MAERIATGEIYIEVNDRAAKAALESIDRDFQRTMRDIEHEKATVTVEGDLTKLDDAVANAKRKVRALDGIVANIDIEADGAEEVIAELDAARREVKRLDGMKAKVELEVRGEEKVLAAQERVRKGDEKAAKAREKAEKDAQKVIDDLRKRDAADAARAQKAKEDWIKRVDRTRNSLLKQQRAEERAAHSEALSMNAAREKAERDFFNRRHSEALTDDRLRKQMSDARLAAVYKEARVSSTLNKQREREISAAHGSALAMERDRQRAERDATVGLAQRTSKVIELQRQYAKLTDQLERVDKRRPIGRESRAKVELDAAGITAKMEALKAELNFLGAHPPVEIKADIDRKGLKRVTGFFGDIITSLANKASGLSDLTLRLGPFTTSIKGAITALSFLGPTIVDIIGAAGALVGVLGAGVAGAATVGGAAVVGLGTSFLGLKFSSRNVGQEIGNARTAINALQKAQEKYGPTADKTKTKQKELNNTLKNITPLARQTALGIESFYKNWDKHTHTTQKNMGSMAKGGFEALNAITPMWAHSTNNLSTILDRALRGGFAYIKGPEFANNFKQITDNFNTMLPTLLHGFGSVGRAAMNFAREGSKAFPMMAHGVDSLGTKLLRFTQSDNFSATVRRWVNDARDLMRFFGAAGRVVMHFFGAGERAGDGFLNKMTAALNRWDDFLTSADGKEKFSDAFFRATHGVEALSHALMPLIGSFTIWASNLSPVVSGFLEGIGYVSRFVGEITKLTGMTGPLGTLGATIGALWAVGKIGAFVSMLARAVTLMRELGALGTLKSIATGGFLGQLRGGGIGAGVAEGGAAAAAEIRSALVTGGAAAAAEIRGAMVTGGAAGAAEGLILPKGVSRAGKEIGVAEKAAAGASFAFMGLEGAAAVAATGGVALLAGAAIYGGYKLMTMKSSADKARDAIKDVNAHSRDLVDAVTKYTVAATTATDKTTAYKTSTDAVNASKDRLAKLEAHGGRNTAAYRSELQNLNSALQQRAVDEAGVQKALARQMLASGKIPSLELARTKAAEALNKAQEEQAKVEDQLSKHAEERNGDAKKRADAAKLVADALAAYRRQTRAAEEAQNTLAASTVNIKRQMAGMLPLAGKAAQAVGKLARQAGGSKVAMSIGLKFADPRDAQRAAQSASRALKAGVNQSIVMKIIADSRDADDAVRKLQSVRLAEKLLKISQNGGETVAGALRRIAGVKLTAKQQRILERGGKAALAMIGAIIAKNIPQKNVNIALKDHASSRIDYIRGLIAALHDKTVNITTVMRTRGLSKKASQLGTARGGIPVPAAADGLDPTDRAIARAQSSMFKGLLPTSSTQTTQRGMKVHRPRVLVGEETGHPEFVIATNPKHRDSNIHYLREAARALGVDSFAKSGSTKKGPTHVNKPHHKSKLPLSNSGKARARSQATKHIKKSVIPNPGAYDEVKSVTDLKQQEDDQLRLISQAENRLNEPDTFLKVVDHDANGEPLYALDDKAVADYKKDIDNITAMYSDLIKIVGQLQTAVKTAIGAVNTAIDTSTKNIKKLNKLEANERNIINGKGNSESEVAAAKERLGRYEDEEKHQTKVKEDAKTSRDSLEEERHDIPFRLTDYADAKAKNERDSAAVAKMASDQLEQATPTDTRSTSEKSLDSLGAELAMSEAGLGGRPVAEIQRAMIEANKGAIAEGNAMLADANPGNDAAAYSMIQTAAQNISGLNSDLAAGADTSGGSGGGGGTGGSTDTGPTAAAQSWSLGSARSDLYNAFGGNALGGVSGAAIQTLMGGGGFGMSPAMASFAMAGSGGQQAAAMLGGSPVIINNYFQTQPDPHTWTQAMQFELAAAM